MGRLQQMAALVAAMALAMSMSGCGGGGGDAGSSTPPPTSGTNPPATSNAKVSGVVFAGLVRNAEVRIYDASKYVVGGTNAEIASATTDAKGAYSATLPGGYANALLVRARGKADLSSSLQDPVFGSITLSQGFELESVVPAHAVQGASAVTANVTAFTNAMAALVSRKLGRSDLDAAIDLARQQVQQRLASGLDPLTGDVAGAKLALLSGAVSNIARATPSNAVNDPYNCAGAATSETKIVCAMKTSNAVLQPLAVDADPKNVPAVNYGAAAALATAAGNLDISLVATNTGLGSTALTAAKEEVLPQLAATTAAAGDTTSLSTVHKLLLRPGFARLEAMKGSISFSSGPHAGQSYTVWEFGFGWGCNPTCTPIGPWVTVSAEDQMEDPDALKDARAVHAELDQRLRALLAALSKADKYPTKEAFDQALNAGIKAGLSAQNLETAVATVTASLASAGYAVPAGPGSASPLSSAEQVAAAQSCMDASEYQNPTATPFDPQLDSNCRLAQVDACIHRKTGVTDYDREGRAACSIVSDMIKNLTGTWRCNYCPYPY